MSDTGIKSGFFHGILEWIITIIIAVVVALFIVGNIGGPSKVSGQSMEPNFHDGDTVIIYRLGYRFRDIRKGDVVVLNKDKEKNGIFYNMLIEGKDVITNIAYKFGLTENINTSNLVKRVIATEGDKVELKDGYVYVNDEIEVDYGVKGYTFPYTDLENPIIVSKNHYFVLGDNREDSLDSRGLGLISKNNIKGKVTFRVGPFSRIGRIK